MDFGLSQDQVLFKDTLHRWLDAECPTTRVRVIYFFFALVSSSCSRRFCISS
jgi:hypothetical protein